jgi:hypothetical protein
MTWEKTIAGSFHHHAMVTPTFAEAKHPMDCRSNAARCLDMAKGHR